MWLAHNHIDDTGLYHASLHGEVMLIAPPENYYSAQAPQEASTPKSTTPAQTQDQVKQTEANASTATATTKAQETKLNARATKHIEIPEDLRIKPETLAQSFQQAVKPPHITIPKPTLAGSIEPSTVKQITYASNQNPSESDRLEKLRKRLNNGYYSSSSSDHQLASDPYDGIDDLELVQPASKHDQRYDISEHGAWSGSVHHGLDNFQNQDPVHTVAFNPYRKLDFIQEAYAAEGTFSFGDHGETNIKTAREKRALGGTMGSADDNKFVKYQDKFTHKSLSQQGLELAREIAVQAQVGEQWGHHVKIKGWQSQQLSERISLSLEGRLEATAHKSFINAGVKLTRSRAPSTAPSTGCDSSIKVDFSAKNAFNLSSHKAFIKDLEAQYISPNSTLSKDELKSKSPNRSGGAIGKMNRYFGSSSDEARVIALKESFQNQARNEYSIAAHLKTECSTPWLENHGAKLKLQATARQDLGSDLNQNGRNLTGINAKATIEKGNIELGIKLNNGDLQPSARWKLKF